MSTDEIIGLIILVVVGLLCIPVYIESRKQVRIEKDFLEFRAKQERKKTDITIIGRHRREEMKVWIQAELKCYRPSGEIEVEFCQSDKWPSDNPGDMFEATMPAQYVIAAPLLLGGKTIFLGHASDCALHSQPAYPVGPCDCGAMKEPSHPAT